MQCKDLGIPNGPERESYMTPLWVFGVQCSGSTLHRGGRHTVHGNEPVHRPHTHQTWGTAGLVGAMTQWEVPHPLWP